MHRTKHTTLAVTNQKHELTSGDGPQSLRPKCIGCTVTLSDACAWRRYAEGVRSGATSWAPACGPPSGSLSTAQDEALSRWTPSPHLSGAPIRWR
jgi:hypothetical protein